MPDAFERVLRLVAEGRLTADEAGPILDALGSPRPGGGAATSSAPGDGVPTSDGTTEAAGRPRFARIEVRDGGKRVVDLRIPISLGRFALGRVPGLSAQHISDVERAVASGDRGPILDVQDEDGDGVRIVLE
jgi:hypothetical protein